MAKEILQVVFRRTLDRHFTWLSATIVGLLVLLILLLLIFFVPGIEPGTTLDWGMKIGAAFITFLTFVSSIITLQHWWSSIDQPFFNRVGSNSPDDSDNGVDSTGLSSPAEGFVESDEEIYDWARMKLDGWFWILDDGEIRLKTNEDLHYDRKGMLYIFAARVAFDARKRESPQVSKQELLDTIGGTTNSMNVFLNKMGDKLIKNYETAEEKERMNNEELIVELNIRNADKAAKYIRGE